jgi:hypothetical protein
VQIAIDRSRLALALIGAAAALLAWAGTAQANNVMTLDAQAATPGHVAQDAAGTAYLAWTRKAPSTGTSETVEFCKVPSGGKCTSVITLPIPAPAESVDSPAGAFPVLGGGSKVYVVAPRYVQDDVVIYTSEDGGATFGAGQVVEKAYSNRSNPTNVLLSGSELLIGAYNPGIGYSAASTSLTGLGDFQLGEPGPGGVVSESMALDSAGNPVQAYYNLSSPHYTVDFVHYLGSGPRTAEASWSAAATVSEGDGARLAGGPSGLLLLSEDYSSPSTPYPSVIDVRKYEGSSFGVPVKLYGDAHAELFDAGAIAQSPAGHVAVIWPQYGGKEPQMRLFLSSNGGAGYAAPSVVANLGSAYGDQDNAQLTVGDDNKGWFTFLNAAGLQLANLDTGAAGAKSTQVGSDVVTLSGPKSCVKAGAKITLTLSVKSAKRKHTVVLKIYQVLFGVDGKVFKTEVRESVRKTGKVDTHPFVAFVKKTFGAGSKHTLSAQAFISEKHGKHASRTLRVPFTVCS